MIFFSLAKLKQHRVGEARRITLDANQNTHPVDMSSSALIEVFSHILFSFTQGVTEHYNPQEPAHTAESFGYDPQQSTGREWFYHPVDQFISQEYSDREATSLDYLASSSLDIKVINACSPDQIEETQDDQQDEDRAMAWKRLKPSALRTVCKSMYIGALISLLTAIIIGSVYMLITYLSYKSSIPLQLQWLRTICGIISCAFIYMWYFATALFLFRRYRMMGVKRKLFMVCCFVYCLASICRVTPQALGIFYLKISSLQKIPLNILFSASVGWQVYLLTIHFRMRRTRKQEVTFFLKMILPGCSHSFFGYTASYPAYKKQNDASKLLIALFAPLIGVIVKTISRTVSVQRLWNIV